MHQQLVDLLSPGWEQGWQSNGFAPLDQQTRDTIDSVNYLLWTRLIHSNVKRTEVTARHIRIL